MALKIRTADDWGFVATNQPEANGRGPSIQ